METILPRVGVILGWLLNIIYSYFKESRDAYKSFNKSVLQCRDRLKAIKEISGLDDKKKLYDEIYHLGAEKNEYLNAIANYQFDKEKRFDISGRMQKILISHNLGDLDNLIKDLETLPK